jgi:hypothetical protein
LLPSLRLGHIRKPGVIDPSPADWMQFLALAPPGPAGPHPGSRFSVGKEQLRREGSRRGRFVSRHPSSSAGITFNVVCGRDDGHRRSELQPAETATRRRSCSRGAMVEPRILARIWRWGMFGSMLVQRIAPRSVCHPPSVRPLLVFDGECPFCRQWVEYVTVGECFDIESFQSAAARFPELAPAQFEQAVQLILTVGCSPRRRPCFARGLWPPPADGCWLAISACQDSPLQWRQSTVPSPAADHCFRG